MPLSEDEQRILSQIEQQFYESDPAFAATVRETTLYRHAFRKVKWAALGLLFGLGFLVATLQVHVLVAFGGFLIMLLCAFVIERNVRAMGKAGLEQVTASFRQGKLREGFGPGRFTQRFRKDD
jgi:Protein of unknown function (DUF3040)